MLWKDLFSRLSKTQEHAFIFVRVRKLHRALLCFPTMMRQAFLSFLDASSEQPQEILIENISHTDIFISDKRMKIHNNRTDLMMEKLNLEICRLTEQSH